MKTKQEMMMIMLDKQVVTYAMSKKHAFFANQQQQQKQ